MEELAPEAIAARPVVPVGATAAEVLIRYADEVSPNKRGGRWEQVG